MVILEQENTNNAFVTCSRNKSLANPTYLWTMRHKLSQQSWKFIPYVIPPATSGYLPAYDAFEISVFSGTAENYIGTSGTSVNLHFIPGEYYLKIYEQLSPTNLNPAVAYDVVYEGMVIVNSDNPTQTISYSGTTDIFIVYGES